MKGPAMLQKVKLYVTLGAFLAVFAITLRGWYEFMKEYGQWLTSLKDKKN